MAINAAIFDMDGVVTDTAKIHFIAWKRMFDEFLATHAKQKIKSHQPFTRKDYLLYVDGKPRIDGIKSFFQARRILVPLGAKDDDELKPTIYGLAKKKQKIFIEHIDQHGVPLFPDTIEFIRQLHNHNIKTAIVSSSKNCQMILSIAGIEDLFAARVDGSVLDELDLAGKPQPDMFLEAARRINVKPCDAVIVEDALSGIQAGKKGKFALVIGIDIQGTMKDIFYANGADIVIHGLNEITVTDINDLINKKINNA